VGIEYAAGHTYFILEEYMPDKYRAVVLILTTVFG